MRVAIPSMLPGGVEAPVSNHFGHCQAFTVVTLEGQEVAGVEVVANGHHDGCGGAVRRLLDSGVEALLVGGIGMRPLEALRSQGARVFITSAATVGEALNAFRRGELSPFEPDQACRGSHGPEGCPGH